MCQTSDNTNELVPLSVSQYPLVSLSVRTQPAMKMQLIEILLLLPTTMGLIGYDCTGKDLNITTPSLTEIGDCRIDDIEPTKEETYVQLLQLSEFDKIQITQCKIEIDRTIYYCELHSHVSIVQNGAKVRARETNLRKRVITRKCSSR